MIATDYKIEFVKLAISYSPLVFDSIPARFKTKELIIEVLDVVPSIYNKIPESLKYDCDVVKKMVSMKKGYLIDKHKLPIELFPVLMKEHTLQEILALFDYKEKVRSSLNYLARKTHELGLINELLLFDPQFIYIYKDIINAEIVTSYLDAGGSDPLSIPAEFLNHANKLRIILNNPLSITKFYPDQINNDMVKLSINTYPIKFPIDSDESILLITEIVPFLKKIGFNNVFIGLLTSPVVHDYYTRITKRYSLEHLRTADYFAPFIDDDL
jgi:hypothetical protein